MSQSHFSRNITNITECPYPYGFKVSCNVATALRLVECLFVCLRWGSHTSHAGLELMVLLLQASPSLQGSPALIS